jgi:hypothetical protein
MDIDRLAASVVHRWASPPVPTTVHLTARETRVWPALSREIADHPDASDPGALGEAIVIAFLRTVLHETGVQLMGGSAYPFDVLSDQYALDAKIGLVSNVPKSCHWRCTFSQPKAFERAKLATMTPSALAQYRHKKRVGILDRKHLVLQLVEKTRKRTLTPITVGLILAPVTSAVDLYWVPGFHTRIGWLEAAPYYRASYQVQSK